MKWKKFCGKKSILLLLSLPFCVLSCTTEQPPAFQASVTINTDTAAKPYDPMIFGGFLEHFGKEIYGGVFDPGSPLSDDRGFRTDVIKALKELKAPVIRWPGGCFVDGYHWINGVGKSRKPKDDIRWGVIEPNTFGTDEFIELCRRLQAEPYICQNSLAPVREMSDWVEYCNAGEGKFAEMRKKDGYPDPFDVRIWSVGNEQTGHHYIDRVRDAGNAMKEVDSGIQLTCSGTYGDAHIDPYLFKTAGKYLNYISVHDYWIANFQKLQTPGYLSCMMLSEGPETYIESLIDSIRAAVKAGLIKEGQIKIAFDEWNLRSWHHPGFPRNEKADYNDPEIKKLVESRSESLNNTLYTMSDALFAASFFNACLRHSDYVAMANISPLVNQTGPLYVCPEGIVRRPQFHTMAMYANELEPCVGNATVTGSKLLYGKDSVALVDAIATVDKKGESWAISLVNRHPSESVACLVKLGDQPLNGKYRATILSADTPDAFNDMEHPDRVAPKEMELSFEKGIVILPPHSLIIVHIPAGPGKR